MVSVMRRKKSMSSAVIEKISLRQPASLLRTVAGGPVFSSLSEPFDFTLATMSVKPENQEGLDPG